MRCTYAFFLFFTMTCPKKIKRYNEDLCMQHIVFNSMKYLETALTATAGESPEGCICIITLLVGVSTATLLAGGVPTASVVAERFRGL